MVRKMMAMRKIRWQKSGGFPGGFLATVGGLTLQCHSIPKHRRAQSNRWYAHIYCPSVRFSTRSGPIRYSIERAKTDAIRLAVEFLLDYDAALSMEKANFGL